MHMGHVCAHAWLCVRSIKKGKVWEPSWKSSSHEPELPSNRAKGRIIHLYPSVPFIVCAHVCGMRTHRTHTHSHMGPSDLLCGSYFFYCVPAMRWHVCSLCSVWECDRPQHNNNNVLLLLAEHNQQQMDRKNHPERWWRAKRIWSGPSEERLLALRVIRVAGSLPADGKCARHGTGDAPSPDLGSSPMARDICDEWFFFLPS